MMRDRFTFYRSFSETINKLPDTERLKIYEAIAAFSLDHIEPQLSGVADIVWGLIQPVLESNWTRYENGTNGGAPNGNKNNRKSTKSQPKVNQDSTESQPKVNHRPI